MGQHNHEFLHIDRTRSVRVVAREHLRRSKDRVRGLRQTVVGARIGGFLNSARFRVALVWKLIGHCGGWAIRWYRVFYDFRPTTDVSSIG